MTAVFVLLGIACLAYYGVCVHYAGIRVSYLWVWLAGGGTFISAAGILWLLSHLEIAIPSAIRIMGAVAAAVVLLLLAVLLLYLGTGMKERPVPDLDILIILGARVKGKRPTKALAQRISRAEAYLRENPDTKAILSGGQGPDEEISEAEAMYRGLVQMGISPERLILEDHSTTTKENLFFSRQWIGAEDRVGIVTSDFHIARSLAIARESGYTRVWGIPAPLRSVLLPHYLLREGFALLRYWFSKYV